MMKGYILAVSSLVPTVLKTPNSGHCYKLQGARYFFSEERAIGFFKKKKKKKSVISILASMIEKKK